MTAPIDHVFLAACRGEATAHPPVWFMRQAGRSLPEYRAIRGEGRSSTAIANPDLAAEITLQPVRRYGVDAAILYSDIVVPVAAIGFGVDVAPGTGPVVAEPFRAAADLDRLRPLDPEADTPYVLETVRILAKELDRPADRLRRRAVHGGQLPRRGRSARAPGPRPRRSCTATRASGTPCSTGWPTSPSPRCGPRSTRGRRPSSCSTRGPGSCTPPTTAATCSPTAPRCWPAWPTWACPASTSASGTGELLGLMAEAGADVVGVDWRVPLDVARRRLGPDGRSRATSTRPSCLCDVGRRGRARPSRCWPRTAAGAPGHIFNLGHGVLPETDPAILERLVEPRPRLVAGDQPHRRRAMAYGTPRHARRDRGVLHRHPAGPAAHPGAARRPGAPATTPSAASRRSPSGPRPSAPACRRRSTPEPPASYQVVLGMKHAAPTIEDGGGRPGGRGRRSGGGAGAGPALLGVQRRRVPRAGRAAGGDVRRRGPGHRALAPAARLRRVRGGRRASTAWPACPTARRSLFTAHSLPERILAAGDPYPDELRATAAAVAAPPGSASWARGGWPGSRPAAHPSRGSGPTCST